MSKCNIRFQYNQKDIVIKCNRNERMKDIFARYESKSKLSIKGFYFKYDDERINPDLSLSQVNDKDNEILVLVFPKEKEYNMEKSDFIKCTECSDPAIIDFLSDYRLSISDKKHGTKKIKLEDFNNSQMIDQSTIKCSGCPRTIGDISKNKFIYCFDCRSNFCPYCKNSRHFHKNMVNYLNKFSRCPQHIVKNFVSYCFNCEKNLCFLCLKEHKEHKIISFMDLYEQEIKSTNGIQKIKELFDTITDIPQKLKENLNVYLEIYEKLNACLLKMNVNYQILKSMKNLNEMNFLIKDIDNILEHKDDDKKSEKFISILSKMDGTSNNVINAKDFEVITNLEHKNKITLKIKVKKKDVNKNI